MADLWPAMEPRSVRSPAPGEHTPAPPAHLSDLFLDNQRTGSALVLSGFFLVMIGAAFTALGWQRYRPGAIFEWTQLMGPALISVGGTLMLSSACKFATLSCCSRGRSDEEAPPAPVPDPSPRGLPCGMGPINPPIVVHNSAAMLCIPPPYNCLPQNLGSVGAALPPYQAVQRLDAAAPSQQEGRSESRPGNQGGDDSGSRPPAYEDLYPSSGKHTLH